MLLNEGFRYDDYVDIFDAGPTVHAQQTDIKTIRDSHVQKLITVTDTLEASSEFIICHTSLENFRVCRSEALLSEEGIALERDVADALLCSEGDNVRVFHLL